MGKMKFCKKCGKVVEFKEESIIEGGQLIKYTTCDNCGDRVKTTKNHIQYGDDRRSK